MFERASGGTFRRPSRGARKPLVEGLEGRQLLTAALAPIGSITAPVGLGVQVPLNGTGATSSQTFSASSTNNDIKATIAKGQFLTFNITHTAADSTDISFAGQVTIQLFEDLTPKTAAQIESIVQSGFYTTTGNTFHRIASGFPTATTFIEQGGSVNGDGGGQSGLPGTPFPDEFSNQLAFTGAYQVALANSGPDTNDTQFYFTTGSPRALDFGYTIFGQVVADPSNVIGQMTQIELTTDAASGAKTFPKSPVNITAATLATSSVNGVVHIDATGATAGETSTVTVTARDASGNVTNQSFPVTVAANTQVEKPYLLPISATTTVVAPNSSTGLTQNQVMYTQTVGLNQPNIFQLQAVTPTAGDSLTYVVAGGITTSTTSGTTTTSFNTTVANATATVNQTTGVVTVTPTANYSGPVYFLVGVRDQTDRSGTGTLSTPSNYDYHWVQLTVNSSSTNVNLAPIATGGAQSVIANQPTTVQLSGLTANPNTQQTLSYTLVSQPTHGTITNFNASTGTLTYTPTTNFGGADTFKYQVSAVGQGASNPPLTSNPSTETLNVTLGQTGAVRLINNVLVVTPVPRTDKGTNTILLTQVANPAGTGDPVIEVFVNGQLDATQPTATSLDQIVVFGSKATDNVTIDPSVSSTIPVTLDGGHGGHNVLQAGAGTTLLHGWFGKNTLKGGTGPNELIGRAGHVKFKPTTATTLIFAGQPHPGRRHYGRPPGGTFFRRTASGRIVPIPTPSVSRARISQATTG